MSPASAERALRSAVALVWLATGLLVVVPYYRAEGVRWLAPLGFGAWLMVATCLGEIVLAAVVLWRRTDLLQAFAQTAPILAFTAILAVLDPRLLAHPFGVLTKNIPIVTAVWTAYLLEREGFTPRVDRLLRVAAGLIWITEGIFPKLFFQSPLEIGVLGAFGIPASAASAMIRVTGVAQTASGVLVFTLRGRALRALLLLQIAALVFLPALVTWTYPEMWAHPFGPLTKNVVIVASAYVLWRRCTPTSS